MKESIKSARIAKLPFIVPKSSGGDDSGVCVAATSTTVVRAAIAIHAEKAFECDVLLLIVAHSLFLPDSLATHLHRGSKRVLF